VRGGESRPRIGKTNKRMDGVQMEVASVSARLSLRRVWVLAGVSVGRITQRMNGWRTLRTGRACPCLSSWKSFELGGLFPVQILGFGGMLREFKEMWRRVK
jgi:hypothetical protein